MLNLETLNGYKENNRIEAKLAQGGLPKSIWETYSAFANSNGGVILLGVEEAEDKSLSIAGLKNPEKLIADFWNTINNSQKISINLLNDDKVRIIENEGVKFISIEVPRAERIDKPVYIGENPLKGTYKRCGEGDFHCGEEEVSAMFRDKSIKTQDMLVLDKMDYSVFCEDSLRSYRNAFRFSKPNHIWTDLQDDDFLYRIGALAYGEDGKLHPTAGGLLMFGYEYEILKSYSELGLLIGKIPILRHFS